MTFMALLTRGQEVTSKFQMLNELIGEWEGTGWVITPDREKKYTNVHEKLTYKLDSSIIYIEGKGYGQKGGQLIHDAIGIAHLDPAGTQVKLMAFTAEGRNTLTEVNFLTDDSFEWVMQLGASGMIRYTTVLNNETWTEKGSFSRDGETWNQFFEMTLTKKF